ncbi:MAG: hypothetical protein KGI53_01395 [Nitrospirota bacterium]|nr:hypothetical protein [Nitrospirota bacterium]
MALPKHLDEAVARLKGASLQIERVRAKPATLDNQQAWLAALTDFSMALSDIQEYNNESIHEKLHEIAARAGLRQFPGTEPKRTS